MSEYCSNMLLSLAFMCWIFFMKLIYGGVRRRMFRLFTLCVYSEFAAC